MKLDELHTTINRYNEAYRDNTSNTDILKEIVKLFDSLSARRLEKSLEKASITDLELWGDILSISAYAMTTLAKEDNTLPKKEQLELLRRAELCYKLVIASLKKIPPTSLTSILGECNTNAVFYSLYTAYLQKKVEFFMIKSQLEKGEEPRNFKKSLERIANTFKLFHTKLLNDYKDPVLSNKYRIDAHFLENLTTNIEDIEKLQKNFPSRKRKVVSEDTGQRPARRTEAAPTYRRKKARREDSPVQENSVLSGELEGSSENTRIIAVNERPEKTLPLKKRKRLREEFQSLSSTHSEYVGEEPEETSSTDTSIPTGEYSQTKISFSAYSMFRTPELTTSSSSSSSTETVNTDIQETNQKIKRWVDFQCQMKPLSKTAKNTLILEKLGQSFLIAASNIPQEERASINPAFPLGVRLLMRAAERLNKDDSNERARILSKRYYELLARFIAEDKVSSIPATEALFHIHLRLHRSRQQINLLQSSSEGLVEAIFKQLKKDFPDIYPQVKATVDDCLDKASKRLEQQERTQLNFRS